ncbi:His/Gly/Thr/Pro-type tRNA ligase C-terminal domain-containing protein [Gloeocapsa sp. PCC 73106]|uniref:His/Gly/Thr/Pro-type tRNA ligase C-terminal domain-containing protein n=1 Tax=Gloeocapsa sp. PCC 73106 TaxID=102232 RepID=UPI0009FD2F1E
MNNNQDVRNICRYLGVKFKDADLIGIPYRIVTGRSLSEGKVELVERATKKSQLIPVSELVSTLKHF